MIKGLAITPPILGRISIGRVVERNGKRLPEKDDQFTITSQIQNQEGWITHPLDEKLRQETGSEKLRRIPVRMLFNDPDLSLRAEYTLFDRSKGRPLCVGNGETYRRFLPTGEQTGPCPSPDHCELGRSGACKPFGRLNVRIGEDDELGSFIFRTTGFNSIRVLAARLRYFSALSGQRLAFLPLELKLRGKSTAQSFRTPIYYVDLTLREGMTLGEAMTHAKAEEERYTQLGIQQEVLDEAARLGFANGLNEESLEDTPALVEEFFPEDSYPMEDPTNMPSANTVPNLKQRMNQRMRQQPPQEQSA